MDEQFLFGNVTVDDWYSYNKSNIHNELDVNPFFIFNGLSMKHKNLFPGLFISKQTRNS